MGPADAGSVVAVDPNQLAVGCGCGAGAGTGASSSSWPFVLILLLAAAPVSGTRLAGIDWVLSWRLKPGREKL